MKVQFRLKRIKQDVQVSKIIFFLFASLLRNECQWPFSSIGEGSIGGGDFSHFACMFIDHLSLILNCLTGITVWKKRKVQDLSYGAIFLNTKYFMARFLQLNRPKQCLHFSRTKIVSNSVNNGESMQELEKGNIQSILILNIVFKKKNWKIGEWEISEVFLHRFLLACIPLPGNTLFFSAASVVRKREIVFQSFEQWKWETSRTGIERNLSGSIFKKARDGIIQAKLKLQNEALYRF